MNSLPTISRYQVFKHRKRILANPLPYHNENFEKFGDVFRIKVSHKIPVVFTRNPAQIKHILQKQHKKYYKSPIQTVDLAKYIGHGILTSNGLHWRTHRRMVQPAFHKKKLEGLLNIMKDAIVGELQRIETNKALDVFPLMSDLAFQVVAKSLFSRSDIRNQMERLQLITAANQKMLIKEMRQPYFSWWFRLTGEIGKHLKLSKEGRGLLNEIIEERLAPEEEKDDLLDMLLAARYEDGTPMSREQLLDEVVILFTAGHETTANALSFALFLLAKHPEVQNKARQEVMGIDIAAGDIFQQIGQLSFVKQCVEEALRLYPPAYVIDRILMEEDTFEGITYDKGTLFLMSIYEIHRYSKFWETPEEFCPERFDAANGKDFSEYYYPFGAGPRMCVGNNFAMYEMILTLAEILQKYKISTTMETVEINPMISLKPEKPTLTFSTF
ncbi:cytochrome P450 [Spongiimicrobium sp. 3-5]|uniref:cytochrome P450 n=1 Tax=Spongiimicrobium sp. 3-5 TaxID=3332596 RepID=UPI00397F54D2